MIRSCHAVPLAALVFASGCYLDHGRTSRRDSGTRVPPPSVIEGGAPPPTFDAGPPPPTFDAGAPFDAGPLPECPPVSFGFACTDTETGYVLPDTPTELPIFVGDLGECYCGENLDCVGAIVGPGQLELRAVMCPGVCDGCFPFVEGSCALPPLSEGVWHATVDGEDAFDFMVSSATPGIGPVDRCHSVTVPEPICGSEWFPRAEPVDQLCVPTEMPAGTPIPVQLTDFCMGCGSSFGSCEVVVTANDVQVIPRSLTSSCDVDCPDMCFFAETTCYLPPLPRGEYNVRIDGIPGVATLTMGDTPPSGALSCISRPD